MCARSVVMAVVSSLCWISQAGHVCPASAAPPSPALGRAAPSVLVNLAVDAATTATSTAPDHPAQLATDGDAATAWCPSTMPASLTVDLGRAEVVTLADLAARYDKAVMIVETQYGWTLQNGDSLGNFLWQDSQVIPGYPATPDGQLAFTSDLISALAHVPGGRGAGIFYWQPEWIPGVGWTPGAGSPNDNLTLFDFSGGALPSVQFTDPLRACRQFAPGQAPCTF